MRKTLLSVLLGALLFAVPAAAQETRGAIEGVIKDSSGAVLPGVTVEAKGPTGTFSSVTDALGVYRFPALDPGTYEVSATLAGFETAKVEAVALSVGKALKVDLTLAVGGLAESIQVSSESPTIDVKRATAATNIKQEQIDRIPKGRDFSSLVTLAPGANNETRSGGLSIDGASAAENKYFLDGIDTTNLRTGVSATPFLSDFIEEVQVKSSGYAAEFGGTTGGVVSVISKSGTNQFRGDFGAYYTNNSMNGELFQTSGGPNSSNNPVRSLRLLLSGVNAAETVQYEKDDYSRTDPFLQLGGPIMKDKMWFWVGYAPQLENTQRTVTFRSNLSTSDFEAKETTQNLVGNVTWQIAQPTRLKVSGQYRPYKQEGRLPAVDGTSNPATAFAKLGQEQDNNTATASFDWVASNRAFFNIRGNYLAYDTQDVGIPDEVWHTFVGSNLQYETRPDDDQGERVQQPPDEPCA